MRPQNLVFTALLILLPPFVSASVSQPANIYTFSGDWNLGIHYTVFQSSGQHYIGARGDTVYVVTSNGWVGCQKSTDGGQTFGPPVRVNSTPWGWNPSMRVDTAGIIYVAYQDEYYGDGDIYFTKSTDGGATFTPAVKVNDDPDTIPRIGQELPALAVNNKGQVFIAWRDQRTAPGEPHKAVFAAASYNGGQSFAPNVQGNEVGTIMSGGIDIAADDSERVYIAFRGTTGEFFGIVVARSDDSGLSYGYHALASDLPPPDSTGRFAEDPSIAVSTDRMVGVAWQDGRFDQFTLRFSLSQDCGQTFSPSIRVDDDSNLSSPSAPQTPSLVWRNGMFYLAWRDPNPDRVLFSYSSDGGASFAPSKNVNPFNSAHLWPSLAINGKGRAFVAWLDNRLDPVFGENYHTFVAWGAPDTVKGDLNLDGTVNVVDVVLLLNAVFVGQSFPASFETADVNCDTLLGPSDAVFELLVVFRGTPFPCNYP